MTSEEFKLAYKKLNYEQKKAVDAIEGPVFVIAGPGTGKTQILTLRIANILAKTDTNPEQILAITFTESGVSAMRKRLLEIIGSTAYRVNIFTFHSFCKSVMERFPESFERVIGRVVASDVEKIKIIEQVIDSNHFKILRPFNEPYHYVKAILASIKDLKRENINPAEFSKLVIIDRENFENIPDKIHEKGKYKGLMKGEFQDNLRQIEKNKELAFIYEAYEKSLSKEKLYDYEDMIMEVVRVLSLNKNLLLEIQEEFQYILADEHQDSNGAQNKLLELLSNFHDNPNLFIVGDEKQAIFRFQGASLENFLYFKRLYKDAILVELINNYRSTQSILDASDSLIGNSSIIGKRKKLEAAKDSSLNKPIMIGEFNNQKEEYLFLAEKIKDLAKKTPLHEIAIFFRNNKEVFPIADILSRLNIPYVIESDQDILHDSDIIKLLLLIRVIANPSSDFLLAELLFADFLDLPIIDSYKLLTLSRKKNIRIFNCLIEKSLLLEAGINDREKFLNLGKIITRLTKSGKNEALPEIFEQIIRESGYLKLILNSENSLSILGKLDALFDVMREVSESNHSAKLNDFLSHLETLDNYGVPIIAKTPLIKTGAVRLMTAHRSKGLEFDYCFITNASDSNFGKKTTRTNFHLPIDGGRENSVDDERRLFYVALTRARKEVFITYSRISLEGKESAPSRFIEEIDSKLRKNLPNFESKNKNLFLIEKKNKGISIKDKKYLREKFFEQGLAVTALNNYLECPWKYFFINLLRLPQEPSVAQYFGTAIHEALKKAVLKNSSNETFSSKEVLLWFKDALSKMPLSEADYNNLLIRGEKALSGYLKNYQKTWCNNTKPEVRISGVPIIFKSGEEPLILNGNLDRLDREGDDVAVFDYKTGKPKTRNELSGKTKNSKGNEYRQLIFYRLLIDRYFEGKLNFKEGVLSFIEPDEKNNYHEERFPVSLEEVNSLEAAIINFAKDITNFSFWDKKCTDPKCQFCELAEEIKRR